MIRQALFIFFLFILNSVAFAQQNVGIGTTSPDSSAALEVKAVDKGVLVPRVADTTLITNPATGLLIYDLSIDNFKFYNGNEWTDVGQASNWSTNGSSISNANSGNVGIGTTAPTRKLDVRGPTIFNINSANYDFTVGSDNNSAMIHVDASTDQVGIGTGTPQSTLDVRGSATFNENGTDQDFKIESESNEHLFFADGSSNNIGIGSNSPDSSAILDIHSTSKGILIPRVTSTSAISNPVDGLLIYSLSSSSFKYYNGSLWKNLEEDLDSSPTNEFQNLSLSGNTLSISNGNSVTISSAGADNDWLTSGNNIHRYGGNVGIGTTSPSARLEVVGTSKFNGYTTFNDNGSSYADFRVESFGLQKMFLLDAGTNRIGIGMPNIVSYPSVTLDVYGSAVFNQGGENQDFRIESDLKSYMFFVDASSDQVGLGTSFPQSTLDVYGSATFNNGSGNHDFRIESDFNQNMFFLDASTNRIGIGMSNPQSTLDIFGTLDVSSSISGGSLDVNSAVINDLGANYDFRVESYSNENMLLVDANTNRVGIGVNYPGYTLDVNGNFRTDHAAVFNEGGSSSGDFRVESNNKNNMLFVDASADRVGIGTSSPGYTFTVNGSTYISSGNFYVDGSTFFVDQGTNQVGIGTINPQEKLTVIGNICYTGSSTSCSDIRYKQNFHPIEDVLSKINRIKGTYYDWKLNEFPDMGFEKRRQIGVIAQEIEPLFPELVNTNDEGFKSVDYSRLTPILLEAIKEQQIIIDAHLKRIKSLESSIADMGSLESRLKKLESLVMAETHSKDNNQASEE